MTGRFGGKQRHPFLHGHLVHPEKCTLVRKRPVGQQRSGQLRTDKTTQTNTTDTIATGGTP
jgi:hypothetical protein